MTRYPTEYMREDGWTDWIAPLPGYRVACCDCGLIHDIETRIDPEGRISFRARTNNRATAQRRRHIKREGVQP